MTVSVRGRERQEDVCIVGTKIQAPLHWLSKCVGSWMSIVFAWANNINCIPARYNFFLVKRDSGDFTINLASPSMFYLVM